MTELRHMHTLTILSADKDAEQMELSYNAGENAK